MWTDLIAQALEEAEGREPVVRGPALMRMARVQMVGDREAARRTFDRGLGIVQAIAGEYSDSFKTTARNLAAAVAPELVAGLPVCERHRNYDDVPGLIHVMIQHGHVEAAYKYAMRSDDPGSFPLFAATELVRSVRDDGQRMTLMRRAIEAWKAPQLLPQHGSFVLRMLLQLYGDLLPLEEARELQRRIDRELAGFEVQQTATDARSGHIVQSKGCSQTGLSGQMTAGDPGDIAFMKGMIRASASGEFGAAMEQAWVQYRSDTDQEHANPAPKEFWPATLQFRNLLYGIGVKLGEGGVRYLAQVPDVDIRLFAKIELAAALSGSPELSAWTTIGGNCTPSISFDPR